MRWHLYKGSFFPVCLELEKKKNVTPLFAEKFPPLNLLHHALDQSYDAVSNEPWGPSFFGVLIYSGKQHTMIHYHENKVGVLDFANLQELGMCLKA